MIRLLTVEHRMYLIDAKTKKEAINILENANLDPKDDLVTLEDIGDFEILDKEED